MALIDKIYCDNYKDYIEFYNWCYKFNNLCLKETQLSLFDYMYSNDLILDYFTDTRAYYKPIPISNFPITLDKWLIKRCPVRWVRDYIINKQYKNSLKISQKAILIYF